MEKKTISYFYVLYCNDGTFYGGYTTELKRREEEHNSGTGAKYTKPAKRRPLRMIYAEAFATRSEATKAEYAFKQRTRKRKIQYLMQQGVKFPLSTDSTCVVNMEMLETKEETVYVSAKEL
ncbi:GIY-YIG nuclease family protein [Desemzia sp. RIT804]|uniref:GIY-YIG nuclease family protein n=1 Tax=Desemzia sp. RIT 804 TaxID=2810209 RepID=UPI00195188BE|nr:GIY-YIG nuclease family protein [Desemzia sp. RIT 804]MBM6615998.1 GIY-YIG nuclease family protein [Desemzia sp. RIT 804]